MSYARRIENNIHGGKYSWKFQSIAKELLDESNGCCICGSKNNLQVHHIVQGNVFDKSYTNKSNIIVVCEECHKNYHHKYDIVNAKTFIEFTKRRHQRTLQLKINDLSVQLNEALNENLKLKNDNKKLKQQMCFII